MLTSIIAETIIKQCLGHKRGESLVIVTDDKLFHLGQWIYRAAKNLNIDVTLIKMPPGEVHGQEPPRAVAQALRAANTALLITSASLSHTRARKLASHKFKVRIASLPGISRKILQRSILVNYSSLKNRTVKLAKILNKAKSARIKTRRGTDLTLSLKGRRGFPDYGLYTHAGDFGNLPAGETCIAPQEGTASGRLIVDASIAGIGKLKKPVEIIIKDGFAAYISSKRLCALLDRVGKNARNVAELGIGLNPKAKITGNVLEDEKASGSAHIAFGNNKSFGGRVDVGCHIDCVFLKPVIFLDGKRKTNLEGPPPPHHRLKI